MAPNRSTDQPGLAVDQGVDSGPPIDDGDHDGHPLGATGREPGPDTAVDGTGGGALLSASDEHTGGPGQELAAGEG